MIFKKIRKGYADWRNFLCSTPARDYVFQKDAYEDQIDRAAKNIRNTDCVIIGAGAGASTAAGIQYGGKRFTDNFAEFIKKYGEYYMTDMYAAGFYPYPSEEAKWGYWSKHALMNRFDPPALPLYTELYDLVKNKEYVRPPRPISNDFLKIQDEYLTERNIERGITDVDTLAPVKSDSRLYIWQGNITTLKCDAIVNACNSQMLGCFSPMHACIDNFIHTYAGMELRLKMHEIMAKQGHEEETGKAKITSGYNLPTKYILHTVGPIIQWKVTKEDEDLLASCYTECLKLAADTGVESIAFCCLSTGVFRFPQQRAAEIATSTVKQYLNKDSRIKKVIFNVFKDEDLKIYSGLL